MDQHASHMVPTLSGHSISNPITNIHESPLQIKREIYFGCKNMQPQNLNPEDKRSEIGDDDDDIFDTKCASDLGANNENGSCRHAPLNFMSNEPATPHAGSTELMHVEVSDRARYGCSSYVDEDIDMQRQDGPGQWDLLYENLCSGYLEPSGNFKCHSPFMKFYSFNIIIVSLTMHEFCYTI
jgi:hypothetical protein